MTEPVQNTQLAPMQQLENLKQQIKADGNVTAEEIKLFNETGTEMVSKKQITTSDFAEALGWFKDDTISNKIAQQKENVQMSKTEARLKLDELKRELKSKEFTYNHALDHAKKNKVATDVKHAKNIKRRNAGIIGGIGGAIGFRILDDLCPTFYGNWFYHTRARIADFINSGHIPRLLTFLAIGGAVYGVTRLLQHKVVTPEDDQKRLEKMVQLETEIAQLKEQIKTLEAQC